MSKNNIKQNLPHHVLARLNNLETFKTKFNNMELKSVKNSVKLGEITEYEAQGGSYENVLSMIGNGAEEFFYYLKDEKKQELVNAIADIDELVSLTGNTEKEKNKFKILTAQSEAMIKGFSLSKSTAVIAEGLINKLTNETDKSRFESFHKDKSNHTKINNIIKESLLELAEQNLLSQDFCQKANNLVEQKVQDRFKEKDKLFAQKIIQKGLKNKEPSLLSKEERKELNTIEENIQLRQKKDGKLPAYTIINNQPILYTERKSQLEKINSDRKKILTEKTSEIADFFIKKLEDNKKFIIDNKERLTNKNAMLSQAIVNAAIYGVEKRVKNSSYVGDSIHQDEHKKIKENITPVLSKLSSEYLNNNKKALASRIANAIFTVGRGKFFSSQEKKRGSFIIESRNLDIIQKIIPKENRKHIAKNQPLRPKKLSAKRGLPFPHEYYELEPSTVTTPVPDHINDKIKLQTEAKRGLPFPHEYYEPEPSTVTTPVPDHINDKIKLQTEAKRGLPPPPNYDELEPSTVTTPVPDHINDKIKLQTEAKRGLPFPHEYYEPEPSTVTTPVPDHIKNTTKESDVPPHSPQAQSEKDRQLAMNLAKEELEEAKRTGKVGENVSAKDLQTKLLKEVSQVREKLIKNNDINENSNSKNKINSPPIINRPKNSGPKIR